MTGGAGGAGSEVGEAGEAGLLGTVVRTDGPGRHRVLLSGPTPPYGAFASLEPDQVGVVVGVTALDTLGGRYDASYEQAPALRGVFDLEVGERIRLAELAVVGSLGPGGEAVHGRPPVAAGLGAAARLLDDDEVRAFHTVGGAPRMAYHALLADLEPTVLDAVLARVRDAVPEAAAYVDLLRREAALRAWRRP